MKTYDAILWQPTESGDGARILRVYGNHAEIMLPDSIQNLPVKEIGSYCFSATEPKIKGDIFYHGNPSPTMQAVCGSFLRKVFLPTGITIIHNAAFYNCRKLSSLSFGPSISSIGSDMFTNCRELKHLWLRGSEHIESGLKIMLERIETDVYVHFSSETDSLEKGLLFFPEYYEWLDEVTPAHLFTRSIHGEGYRMRKAFQGKIFSYEKYDQCFSNALMTESDLCISEIALCRLRYPKDLSADNKKIYEESIRTRNNVISRKIVKEKNTSLLQFLLSHIKLSHEDLTAISVLCTESDWPEGVTLVMEERQKKKQGAKKTFSFDF